MERGNCGLGGSRRRSGPSGEEYRGSGGRGFVDGEGDFLRLIFVIGLGIGLSWKGEELVDRQRREPCRGFAASTSRSIGNVPASEVLSTIEPGHAERS